MNEVWQTPGLIQSAMQQLFNSAVITDADLVNGGPFIVECNPAFCAMTGYSRDELLGRSPRILQGPDTDPAVIRRLKECLLSGTYFEGATVNYRKDGTPYDLQWNISPVRSAEGVITHFVSIQQDVSERLRADRERDVLAQAVRMARDPILIFDSLHRIHFVNPAFERTLGYSADEVRGHTTRMLFESAEGHADYEELAATLASEVAGEANVTLLSKTGQRVSVRKSVVSIVSSSGEKYFVGTLTDVSDLVEAQERLYEQATTDPMTGLFNRRAGAEELDRQLESVSRFGRDLAVVVCDIDHFKLINDRRGHEGGDRVLLLVSDALRAGLRSQDMPVRWGGDEFLVIFPGAASDVTPNLADRLRTAVSAIRSEGQPEITASFGVAQAAVGESASELLRRADDALYRAKANGRNLVVIAD